MPCGRNKKKKKWTGHDWMSRLPSYLQEVPLNILAIPGSHNSYSYAIDPEAFEDRASDPLYQHFAPLINELAVTVSHRWSVTQSLSLTQQLDLGVRYIELRITARPGVDGVYLRNGPNIINGLLEINRWVNDHPGEVIIIEFTETVQLSPAQHRRLLAAITREIFGNKLLDFFENMKTVSIRNILGVAAQVIVFYPKEYMYGYLSIWPSNFIGHTSQGAKTPRELMEKFETRLQHGRPSTVFYCWMGILDPDTSYIENHLTGELRGTMAKPANKAVVTWTKDKNIRDGDMNIVVADFVESSDFCEKVVDINTRALRVL